MQYGDFAARYDVMMHDVDYPSWIRYLDGILKEHGVKTVLDCACGTGQMTIGLAKLGYQTIGSDLSEEMLMQARNNAFSKGMRQIPFVRQNLTDLSTHRAMDAVNCSCDGVNYLTTLAETVDFFASAYRCLKPNGILLFDVSSYRKLSETVGNHVFTESREDYHYTWQNYFDATNSLCEMNLTWFVREGELYRRHEERHLQRAHRVEELVAGLEQTGFTVLGIYDAFTKKEWRADSERIQFVARRNG